MLVRKNGLVISDKDPLSLDTFEKVLAEIEASLSNLALLCTEIDFNNEQQRLECAVNVEQLKRFYERAEFLAYKLKTG